MHRLIMSCRTTALAVVAYLAEVFEPLGLDLVTSTLDDAADAVENPVGYLRVVAVYEALVCLGDPNPSGVCCRAPLGYMHVDGL